MLQVGKRTIALAITALTTLALVLAAPGTSSGATRTAQAAKHTAASKVVMHNDQGTMKSRIVGMASNGHRVTGTFTPESFSSENGKLMANGTLDAVVRKGGHLKTATQQVSIPVKKVNGTKAVGPIGGRGMAGAAAPGSCDILNLVLGPLDLNLLGLTVHLNQVVLNIVAVTGAGNLLGNLLCAVAGLLDGTPLSGLLTQIAGLLNQILGQLQL